MFRKLKRYLKDPYFALGDYMIHHYPNLMSDKFFIETKWRYNMDYPLDLKNPKTFNEKLQWLKLHDHNPLYTTLVDKIKVKDWVAERIGEEYIIPTLAIWDRAEDIDITNLPNRFVLKCNHDSGSVIVCRDKSTFDVEAAKTKLANAMKYNFYYQMREWPYKNVVPKVFAEEYLEFSGEYLMDYRIYCFDGTPKFIYAYTNYAQKDGSKPDPGNCDYFDTNWNAIPLHQHSLPRGNVAKPKCLHEMLEKASLIAQRIPFCRVDFYELEVVNFGEITFYPGGGFSKMHPMDYDYLMGELLKIDAGATVRGGGGGGG